MRTAVRFACPTGSDRPTGVDALAAQAAANGRGWSFGWIGLSAGRAAGRTGSGARGRGRRGGRRGGAAAPRAAARRRGAARGDRPAAGRRRGGGDAGGGQAPRVRRRPGRRLGSRPDAGVRDADGGRRRRPLEARTHVLGRRCRSLRSADPRLRGERDPRRPGSARDRRLRARRRARRPGRSGPRHGHTRDGGGRAAHVDRSRGVLRRRRRIRAGRRDGLRPQRPPRRHRGTQDQHLREQLRRGRGRRGAGRGPLGRRRQARHARDGDHRRERVPVRRVRRHGAFRPRHPHRQGAGFGGQGHRRRGRPGHGLARRSIRLRRVGRGSAPDRQHEPVCGRYALGRQERRNAQARRRRLGLAPALRRRAGERGGIRVLQPGVRQELPVGGRRVRRRRRRAVQQPRADRRRTPSAARRRYGSRSLLRGGRWIRRGLRMCERHEHGQPGGGRRRGAAHGRRAGARFATRAGPGAAHGERRQAGRLARRPGVVSGGQQRRSSGALRPRQGVGAHGRAEPGRGGRMDGRRRGGLARLR